jgi:inositol-1,3,4-trisphosphate 5/6-kinase / inositol-tetrakisphosphate 1-kinase
LEEQHGGKLDVILHKLTEDILCLSQLAMTRPALKNNLREHRIHNVEDTGIDHLDKEDELAVQRVLRLSNFRRINPECCLVDDPACVLTLMSRADIADTLQQCLNGVSSTSGIPVGSPPYAVVAPPYVLADLNSGITNATSPVLPNTTMLDTSWLESMVAGLSFPIIVKPLTAAGTKSSHAMAVIMDSSALQKVVSEKAPCLLQEYSNHDALLYKVYVLGDHVSVHRRRSLPNIPINTRSRVHHVEFDSQRPYPRLSDFGYPSDERSAMHPTETTKHIITVEEIMPIVNSLKEAFGLELFGFDVLINPSHTEVAKNVETSQPGIQERTQLCQQPRRMLVIDVNYFPSYKEVTNFPAVLAKYLTDRVLQSRRKSQYHIGIV